MICLIIPLIFLTTETDQPWCRSPSAAAAAEDPECGLYWPGTGGPGQNRWRHDSLQKYSDCPYNSAYRAVDGSTVLPQIGSLAADFASRMVVYPSLAG